MGQRYGAALWVCMGQLWGSAMGVYGSVWGSAMGLYGTALWVCMGQLWGSTMGLAALWGSAMGLYGTAMGQRYGAAPHLTQNGHSPTISRSRSAAIGRALGPEVGVAKRSPAPGSSSTSSSTSRGPAIGRRSSSTALSLDTSCGRGGLRAGGHAPLPTHPGVPP